MDHFRPVPAFEIAEYHNRLKQVRAEMGRREIDLLVVTSPVNMYYLTGYRTIGYYMYQSLLVPMDREPLFIVRKFETPNVEGLSWAKSCFGYEDWQSPIDVTTDAIKSVRTAGQQSIGYDERGYYMPPYVLDALRAMLPDTKWVPSSGVVEWCRIVKSPAEIKYMRKAADIAVAGLSAAISSCNVGVTENELTVQMYASMLRAGGDVPSNGPFAVVGPRTALPHQTAEGVAIKNGDLVYLECGGCWKRYGAANLRTVFVGKPSSQIERFSEVVIEGLTAAINTMKPGALSGDVDRAARGIVEKAGFSEYWLHRTGYSIGLGFPPTWGEGNIMDLKAGDPRPLQAGMIFHLVPGFIIPGVGSVMFSETVLVTETGSEPLTKLDRKLHVRQ